MKKLKSSYPQAYAICWALGLSIFSYVFMTLDPEASGEGTSSILQRAVFVAAAVLLMNDIVEGLAHQKGQTRSPKDPVFWLYAFYMGYFWFTLVTLMLWSADEMARVTLATWAVTAAAFGIAMAAFPSGKESVPPSGYDLSKPYTEGAYRYLFYMYPVALVVFFLGMAWAYPTSLDDEPQLFFRLILLGSIMGPYEYKEGQYLRTQVPRIVGTTLLLIGFFVL